MENYEYYIQNNKEEIYIEKLGDYYRDYRVWHNGVIMQEFLTISEAVHAANEIKREGI